MGEGDTTPPSSVISTLSPQADTVHLSTAMHCTQKTMIGCQGKGMTPEYHRKPTHAEHANFSQVVFKPASPELF